MRQSTQGQECQQALQIGVKCEVFRYLFFNSLNLLEKYKMNALDLPSWIGEKPASEFRVVFGPPKIPNSKG